MRGINLEKVPAEVSCEHSCYQFGKGKLAQAGVIIVAEAAVTLGHPASATPMQCANIQCSPFPHCILPKAFQRPYPEPRNPTWAEDGEVEEGIVVGDASEVIVQRLVVSRAQRPQMRLDNQITRFQSHLRSSATAAHRLKHSSLNADAVSQPAAAYVRLKAGAWEEQRGEGEGKICLGTLYLLREKGARLLVVCRGSGGSGWGHLGLG